MVRDVQAEATTETARVSANQADDLVKEKQDKKKKIDKMTNVKSLGEKRRNNINGKICKLCKHIDNKCASKKDF